MNYQETTEDLNTFVDKLANLINDTFKSCIKNYDTLLPFINQKEINAKIHHRLVFVNILLNKLNEELSGLITEYVTVSPYEQKGETVLFEGGRRRRKSHMLKLDGQQTESKKSPYSDNRKCSIALTSQTGINIQSDNLLLIGTEKAINTQPQKLDMQEKKNVKTETQDSNKFEGGTQRIMSDVVDLDRHETKSIKMELPFSDNSKCSIPLTSQTGTNIKPENLVLRDNEETSNTQARKADMQEKKNIKTEAQESNKVEEGRRGIIYDVLDLGRHQTKCIKVDVPFSDNAKCSIPLTSQTGTNVKSENSLLRDNALKLDMQGKKNIKTETQDSNKVKGGRKRITSDVLDVGRHETKSMKVEVPFSDNTKYSIPLISRTGTNIKSENSVLRDNEQTSNIQAQKSDMHAKKNIKTEVQESNEVEDIHEFPITSCQIPVAHNFYDTTNNGATVHFAGDGVNASVVDRHVVGNVCNTPFDTLTHSENNEMCVPLLNVGSETSSQEKRENTVNILSKDHDIYRGLREEVGCTTSLSAHAKRSFDSKEPPVTFSTCDNQSAVLLGGRENSFYGGWREAPHCPRTYINGDVPAQRSEKWCRAEDSLCGIIKIRNGMYRSSLFCDMAVFGHVRGKQYKRARITARRERKLENLILIDRTVTSDTEEENLLYMLAKKSIKMKLQDLNKVEGDEKRRMSDALDLGRQETKSIKMEEPFSDHKKYSIPLTSQTGINIKSDNLALMDNEETSNTQAQKLDMHVKKNIKSEVQESNEVEGIHESLITSHQIPVAQKLYNTTNNGMTVRFIGDEVNASVTDRYVQDNAFDKRFDTFTHRVNNEECIPFRNVGNDTSNQEKCEDSGSVLSTDYDIYRGLQGEVGRTICFSDEVKRPFDSKEPPVTSSTCDKQSAVFIEQRANSCIEGGRRAPHSRIKYEKDDVLVQRSEERCRAEDALYGITKIEDGSYRCSVCDCKLVCGMSVLSHVREKQHETARITAMKNDCAKGPEVPNNSCGGELVNYQAEEDHMKGKKHKIKQETAEKNNCPKKFETSSNSCESTTPVSLCSAVSCSLADSVAIVEDRHQVMSVKRSVMLNDIWTYFYAPFHINKQFIRFHSRQIICSLCWEQVGRYILNVRVHISSLSHLDRVNILRNIELKNKSSNKQLLDIPGSLKNIVPATQFSLRNNGFFCSVCNCFCEKALILSHMTGASHGRKLDEMKNLVKS
ncbi:uncharacterized protein LOC124800286 isoform X1 [Schistocerca piceifrons]|uniref:uncharacterized protein LOC124800286 isoform X1 n=1 Tax=Schistocerca piceifrons TaxID=274613 RepID=UPI001F5E7ABB|nr:uncharacterized protein LOC124800286 isoform X1 [Schistocerca piceifrons]XP_047118940.1 uncharacterized protein LOC124800286 isoform X1 [Schistocerca piceifrons]XP_047118941.1 uncharacterized protein LOC124800286 isoform X1 [Schistocerca piceifrons]XP_047118942.1 uncharacterized protein LOC124800286 isoform X1 [Schistocerca piceifrons]